MLNLLRAPICSADEPTATLAVTASSNTLVEQCSHDVMQAAAPPGVVVKDITNVNPAASLFKNTKGGAVYIPANAFGDDAPAYCVVTGSMVTNWKTGKTANFGAALPSATTWNKKFLMEGCGGTCGDVFDNGPPAPSVIRRGYAVWTTDDGHIDSGYADNGQPIGTDSDWAVKGPGRPDVDSMLDYFHRGVHVVADLGKTFTSRFYAAVGVDRSYFLGCSDGGKEAMREATLYPEDFDGLVAGAPFLDATAVVVGGINTQLAQFQSAASVVPAAAFDLVAKAFVAKCDASDGVVDGIVQNPAACNFNPQKDIPRCAVLGGGSSSRCLTAPQINAVTAMFNEVRDTGGHVVAPGFATVTSGPDHGGWGLASWAAFPYQPHTTVGPYPFGPTPSKGGNFWAWAVSDGVLRNLTYVGDPAYASLSTLGMKYIQAGQPRNGSYAGVLPFDVAERIKFSLQEETSSNPYLLANFIAQNRKLIMWHGYGDGVISPYSTVRYYERLATLNGGYKDLQDNVRLFMAPDVGHCGLGGAGPNAFMTLYHNVPWAMQPPVIDADHDMLSALEKWVEGRVPPNIIIASKYLNDDMTKPVVRSMPLCPFPEKARYDGRGNVNDAASWSCPDNDAGLLKVGKSGARAGL
ncbi:tannase/feruloyl esterase family alpha/beta hydrolase [Caballeronia sordidicola]|uniref:tannase/feruloyl esterase family alpha/beta hydrolase n=1 Tax=Caballeronia sordidicola TaxID=196367 RepID=UPI0013625881|nr:tannase/feruloyl esterase family alpha/beta hydrolase [Caballeronia sordidicola]